MHSTSDSLLFSANLSTDPTLRTMTMAFHQADANTPANTEPQHERETQRRRGLTSIIEPNNTQNRRRHVRRNVDAKCPFSTKSTQTSGPIRTYRKAHVSAKYIAPRTLVLALSLGYKRGEWSIKDYVCARRRKCTRSMGTHTQDEITYRFANFSAANTGHWYYVGPAWSTRPRRCVIQTEQRARGFWCGMSEERRVCS